MSIKADLRLLVYGLGTESGWKRSRRNGNPYLSRRGVGVEFTLYNIYLHITKHRQGRLKLADVSIPGERIDPEFFRLAWSDFDLLVAFMGCIPAPSKLSC